MGREIRRVPPDWEHPRYTEDDWPLSPEERNEFDTLRREAQEIRKVLKSAERIVQCCQDGVLELERLGELADKHFKRFKRVRREGSETP